MDNEIYMCICFIVYAIAYKGPVIINIEGGTEEKMVGSRKNIGGSRLG